MHALTSAWERYRSFATTNETAESVARVIAEHKTGYILGIADELFTGILPGKFKYQTPNKLDWPKVGDWVTLASAPVSKTVNIRSVLPRFSTLARTEEHKNKTQIIATNIDTAFILAGLDTTFNSNIIFRFVHLALQGGINPVIILNKADANEGAEQIATQIRAELPDITLAIISAQTGLHLDKINPFLKPGNTIVVIGPSGVGKSTLINTLLGKNLQKTREVSQVDNTGKHTTTSRALFFTPEGTSIIDTPGLRTLNFQDNQRQSLTESFTEIEALTHHCRFTNCDHLKSKDCAVVAALKAKKITQKNYRNYLHYRKESEQTTHTPRGFVQKRLKSKNPKKAS